MKRFAFLSWVVGLFSLPRLSALAALAAALSLSSTTLVSADGNPTLSCFPGADSKYCQPATFSVGNSAIVTGVVYYDLNGNGQLDPGEPPAPSAQVDGAPLSTPASPIIKIDYRTTADANGTYALYIGTGDTLGVYAQAWNLAGNKVADGGQPSFSGVVGQMITENIGLHFVGSNNLPTHFAPEIGRAHV